MVESPACPNLSELLSLVFGTAEPDDYSRLSEHLLSCEKCVKTLRELKADDSLVRQLEARSRESDGHDRALLNSVVQRIRNYEPTVIQAEPKVDSTVGPKQDGSPSLEATIPIGVPRLKPGDKELGRLGAYRIIEVLGEGGMGTVYKAEDTHLQRFVALKVMKQELAADLNSRQRFLREARAMAKLPQERIVTIYQVGQEEDVPYLAMELLQGETLESRMEQEVRLPFAEVLRIGREIAEGLAVAHKAGIVHRDIKPANIWLTSQGQHVKLLDFGLARPPGSSSNLSQTGLIVGTPKYMSPEQARGQELDARSDLFSLGCVLYRMSSGRLPFLGQDTMAIITSLAVDTPPPLQHLNRDLPKAFVDLVNQLLEKKPGNRPESGQVVADALRQIAEDTGAETMTYVAKRPRSRKAVASKSRRPIMLGAGSVLGIAMLVLAAIFWPRGPQKENPPAGTDAKAEETKASPAAPTPAGLPIRVGVLHSLSGTMADSGRAVADATTLALEELKAKGGIAGRPIEYLVTDGSSDEVTFAKRAEELITKEKVDVIFGCWTSAGRKRVKEVVERHNHLLFYPVQYEGLEQSPNIVYNGAAPNQQIVPAVRYCFETLNKRRYYLVGSDYVFPQTANEIIKQELRLLGGSVVGERYLLLGSSDCREIVSEIVQAKPDVILNTLNGDSNRAFFQALRAAGIRPDKVPTVSFSIGEHEMSSLAPVEMIGDYAAWNYFESVNRPENDSFKTRFRARYGQYRRTSDPLEAAYFGVMLWAQAVEKAGTSEVSKVREAIRGQTFQAPCGPVRVDGRTLHTWKIARIGQVVEGGQFKIVWESEDTLAPEPFPATHTRQEWDNFLTGLYKRWGNRWSNPGGTSQASDSSRNN